MADLMQLLELRPLDRGAYSARLEKQRMMIENSRQAFENAKIQADQAQARFETVWRDSGPMRLLRLISAVMSRR